MSGILHYCSDGDCCYKMTETAVISVGKFVDNLTATLSTRKIHFTYEAQSTPEFHGNPEFMNLIPEF